MAQKYKRGSACFLSTLIKATICSCAYNIGYNIVKHQVHCKIKLQYKYGSVTL